VDVKGAALDVCWLIQSEVFVQRATRDTLDRYRFSASAKPGTNDQWREYRLGPSELPAKILQYIDWVDAERLRMMRTLASFPPEPDSL
jgi:hypothetical protein